MSAIVKPRVIRPSLVAAGLAVALVGAPSAVWAQSPPPEIRGVGGDTAFTEHLRGTDWLLVESDRYGYIVSHPPEWTVRSAEREWRF